MTVLADYHMHSSFSGDSESPMLEMVNAAIQAGLHDICFTEHMDLDYPTEKDDPEGLPAGYFEVDVPKYHKSISEITKIYRDRINIGFGLEFGLKSGQEQAYKKIASENDLDFIIASTHLCNNMDITWASFWTLDSEEQLFRKYFETTLNTLDGYTDFDVYGHLDYVVRYAPHKDKYYSYSKYSDIIDEILRRIISLGKGIEINTKGKRCGMSEMNPCRDILIRYRQLGGEIITIGSDAHVPADVGALTDVAGEILKSCGYRYYATFAKRKPSMHNL